MNTAAQVDELVTSLKAQIAAGGIPLSAAMWQTALACVGWPYVYSAWGALCTPSERRKRYGMRPDKTTIKTKCQVIRDNNPKLDCTGCQWYPGNQRTRCADCRGFKDWVYKQYGFDLYGDTVAAQWNHKENWCIKGTIGIDPIPQNVLVDVFIKKDGTWTHTGFYYNGETCECSVNVQHFNPMKKDRWTHWAVAACFKSGWTMPEKEPEKEVPVETVKTLKKGSKGAAVKELQQRLLDLGYKLPRYGADGDYGNETVAAVKAFQKDWGLKQDGIAGPETQKMLNSVPGQQKEKTYRVIVRGLTEAQGKELTGKYPGSNMEEEK